MMSFRVMIVIVIAILVLVGCTKANTNNDSVNSVDSGSVDNGSEDSNTARIVDFAFEPATLTVKTGTTVVWINEDSAPHKIKAAEFNSQNMKKADSFSQTFTQPGVYDYICSIHPSMTGKIIVE